MVHIINATGVCDAFTQGMVLLKTYGVKQPSRGGEVLVMPRPVLTETRRPWERVLFSQTRDANPFFHYMEALWMLAGRRDGTWLDQYITDFSKNYGEEHGIIHGAYGYRWRHAFGFDQLDAVIGKMRRDTSDRQCVIQMWDASTVDYNDLRGNWKDRPCNTHIYLRARADEARKFVLDLTVCCRSNDAIWGAHGSNAVHFSILQEYLAQRIGLEMGTLYQLSNNYHAYTGMFEKIIFGDLDRNLYPSMPRIPLIENEDTFHLELDQVLNEEPLTMDPKIFQNRSLLIAYLMRGAHYLFKKKAKSAAFRMLESMPICDWRRACMEWVSRRIHEPAL